MATTGERSRPAVGERVVFASVVETGVRRLPPAGLTPELKERLRALGIDVDRPLLAAYPYLVWARAVDVMAELSFPGESEAVRMRKLGRRFIDGYSETLVGRALFQVLRLIGPWRTLERTTRSFRTANNYSESKLSRVGPSEAELWLNERDISPEFTGGILQAGLERTGVANVRVEVVRVDSEGFTYRLRWE